MPIKTRLIVHGGAWSIPDEYDEAHVKGVKKAIEDVFPLLEAGKITALDAVELCIRSLEEDDTFDAGKGSFLNKEGEIEMDAIIMNGKDLSVGSVAAIKNVMNPITVARAVMEKTEHCMLVGQGAQKFIESQNIPQVKTEDLLTPRELEFFKSIWDNKEFTMETPFKIQAKDNNNNTELPTPKGTVGCVAMDIHGNIAVGTSTGGLPRKLPGRVGDCPLIGSGAYADIESGGASATGWGETIMRVVLCKRACDQMESCSAQEGVTKAIEYLDRRVGGKAGLIAIDKHGNYGIFYNTLKMAHAYVDAEGNVVASVHSSLVSNQS